MRLILTALTPLAMYFLGVGAGYWAGYRRGKRAAAP